MLCLSEDEFGMPCGRDAIPCPKCELECCESHMYGHPCFPVRVNQGSLISDLQETVERIVPMAEAEAGLLPKPAEPIASNPRRERIIQKGPKVDGEQIRQRAGAEPPKKKVTQMDW